MTLKEAWKSIPEKDRFVLGHADAYFALLAWKSPSGTGYESGPLIISMQGDTGVEVTNEGVFRQCIPGAAEGYFPYLRGGQRVKKDQLKKLIKQLFERIE